jgi:hypothetical protein
MTLPARAAFVVLALASVSACTKVQARTPASTPALETPAPPPRMVVPAPPLEPVPTPEPAGISASAPVGPVRSSPPPANRTPERTNPPAATATSPPATPDPPAPVLQTQQNVGELEQQTRQFLDQAQKNLAKVDPRTLGRDARDQFNLAQRYIDLSRQQMDLKNFVRARVLAENAAALAGQLVK